MQLWPYALTNCHAIRQYTLKLQKCQTIYVYKYFTSLQLPTDSKDGKKVDGGNLFKVKVSLLSIVNALPLVKDWASEQKYPTNNIFIKILQSCKRERSLQIC